MSAIVVVSKHDLDASKSTGYAYNQPEKRKQLIVQTLTESGKVSFNFLEAPVSDLSLAGRVHNPGFVGFFSSAWDLWTPVWELLRGRPDFDFALPDDLRDNPIEGLDVPGFVPSYSAARDAIHRPGPNVLGQINYYCQDRMTPIRANTSTTLRWDLKAIETAAELIKGGSKIVYALVTFPGHHSGPESFGGYCYVNVAAVAASLLREKYSKVAVVDVDYHAGNGTVSIFWNDPSVLVVSLHGDPAWEYPYNAGFADQTGGPDAANATLNIPIPPKTEWAGYSVELERALARVKEFQAEAIVVSLGLDPLRGDPVQSPQAGISLDVPDYVQMGKMFAALDLPLLLVQEGGYDLERVHLAVDHFISKGLLD